jgi:hypothetical protein
MYKVVEYPQPAGPGRARPPTMLEKEKELIKAAMGDPVWHGCIFLNALMEPITSVLPNYWIPVFTNISKDSAQDIPRDAFLLCWSIARITRILPKHLREKNKFRDGVTKNERH